MENKKTQHTFHIPVMGLSYTIDSPIKVAHLGISSVMSIFEHNFIEKMRKFYSDKFEITEVAIIKSDLSPSGPTYTKLESVQL